ncbi:MAG: hypothetical protein Q4E86_14800, partial [Lachnospiraceae bacterium]|nr:hypothetical protein [Lachnospiraceae bacterium]
IMEERSMTDIAYQNKDISSKIVGEALVGQSLAPFGLPELKVVGLLPTNLPVVESNELRLDNLFLLSDGSLAIIDYESDYDKENFVKYINYIARVVKRYAVSKQLSELKNIKMVVIYTADVEKADSRYDLGSLILMVESAFLVKMDTMRIYQELREKAAAGRTLSEEELMKIMILPLTVKGKTGKQEIVVKVVQLAKQLPDRIQSIRALAGILAFSDKVIDESYKEQIKEEMRMTQIERMIFEEATEICRAKFLAEGREEGRKEGRKQGEEKFLISLVSKMLKKGKTPEQIADDFEEDPDKVGHICQVIQEYGADFDVDRVFEIISKRSN